METKVPRPRCSRTPAHPRKTALSPIELSPFRAGAKKNEALLRRVRDLARKHQRQETAQVFLSVREAAARFAASASAIAAVYRQLAREGLLASVRGSRTILRATSTRRSHKIHSLIGIPVSMRHFLAMRDYRDCFQQLDKELSTLGFATRCFFFEDDEVQAASFVSRVARAEVDNVIWVFPDAPARDAVWRLRDRGINHVGISFAGAVKVFCRYEVRRRDAIRAIFRQWRQHARIGSLSVIRTCGGVATDGDRMNRLDALAAAEQIDCEIATLSKCTPEEFLMSLCARKNHGIVIPSSAASVLAWQAPEALGTVLRSCRVSLIDGPINLPAPQSVHAAVADVVTVDWRPIVRKIASDLATGEAFTHDETTIFEAKPLLRVPLKTFVGP